jgi:hypothetical protein
MLVFHDEFYISSTLPHEDIQTLYSYIIGCGECSRDKKKIKIFSYKEAGKTFRIKDGALGSNVNVGDSEQINTETNQIQ